MVDFAAKIKEFEDELRNTAYNKRTQHSIGLLKAKIARLRDKAITRASKGGGGYSYAVRKSGDASVVLVGYPSVGKSTLLNAITNANSEIGSYAFTTLDVVPGLLEYKHTKIQVLDVPGILQGAAIGKGRGREVLSVVRNTNMVLFLIDVNHPEHYPVLQKEVYDTGQRVNQRQPDVKIVKKSRGGINIGTTVKLTKMTKKTAETILREFRINNADVVIRTNINSDQLIDMIEGNKHYIPAITVLTKIDMVSSERLKEVKKIVKPDIMISAEKEINIEKLKELIYKKLDFMSVYCKEVRKKADLDVPLILKNKATVSDACIKLHRDFIKNFKCVKVWGKSAKFPGQRLSLRHVLKDGDIFEIHLR
jgi:uncharacterized protein